MSCFVYMKLQSVPRKGGGEELLRMAAGNRHRVQEPQGVRVLESGKVKVEVETSSV